MGPPTEQYEERCPAESELDADSRVLPGPGGRAARVNWVTVDEKTNMSEGLTMISFYAIIVSALKV